MILDYQEQLHKWVDNDRIDFYDQYINKANKLIPEEYKTYDDIKKFIDNHYYSFICQNKVYNSGIPMGNYYLITLIEYKRK